MNPVVLVAVLRMAVVVAIVTFCIFKLALFAYSGQWVKCGLTALVANWLREALSP